MKFKKGDKVMVTAPSWHGVCTVVKMGYSERIMYVCRADGGCPAIYKSWASIIKPKNQQLIFDFMD